MSTKISTNETKRAKEADRKTSIVKNTLDSLCMLPLAKYSTDKIQQLTQTRVIKAGLSEIPSIIKEFYTDGTSPAKRPQGFYQHLRQEIKDILKRCEEEELEQQRALNNLGKSQSSALPEIAVHLRLPASDDDEIDVSWISDNIETVLDCTRVDVIAHSLSKLIHPDEYNSLHRILMELRTEIGLETSRNLESYECRIAPLWRNRANKTPSYQKVTLRGVIRLWPSQNRTLPAESSAVERSLPPAKRRALAASVSSCPSPSSMPIGWTRQGPTFIHPEIDAYETSHSIENMSFLWVDSRISSVNCWNPEDVIGRSSWDFIETFDLTFAHSVQRLTLDMGRYGEISYALKSKGKGTVYQRSVGLPYTYVVNGQKVVCFKLTTNRISAEEYAKNRRKEELYYAEYPSSTDTVLNQGASRAIEHSVVESGDIVGYQSSGCCPAVYSEPYIYPVSDVLNSISEVQCIDSQPPIAPESSVYDSPISSTESPDSSFSNQDLSFTELSEYLNYA